MQLLFKDFSINSDINNEWINKNCYVAGGACVSYYTRTPINDVDIYFKTKEARDYFLEHYDYGEYYISKDGDIWKALIDYDSLLEKSEIEIGQTKMYGDIEIHSSKCDGSDGKEILYYSIDNEYEVSKPLLEKQKWMFDNGYDYVLLIRNHFEVPNSNEFLGNKSITIKEGDLKYQFILRFYGEPQQMMDRTFDFQHCKIAYDLDTREYIATDETWKALTRRELKYVNSYYPISSLKRLNKYQNRKFTYTNDEFVKILRDVAKLDLDNKYVVEDQLIGYYEDFNYNEVFQNKNLFEDIIFNPFTDII